VVYSSPCSRVHLATRGSAAKGTRPDRDMGESMDKLNMTRRAIVNLAAALAVAIGATVTAAGSASATIGCTGGDGCSHQTTIAFNNQGWEVGEYSDAYQLWGPYTVLRIEGNGDLALYCYYNGQRGARIWHTDTVDDSWRYQDNFVYAQSTGNLSVWHYYAGSGDPTAVWASLTSPPTIQDRGAEAIVQADGNFVIYDSAGNALWSSNTYHACPGTLQYWG